MTLYVESSAWVKRYIDENDSEEARRYMDADHDWVTANHTYVEVYRALFLSTPPEDLFERDVSALIDDWDRSFIVVLDDALCRRAATLTTMPGVRTLDAFHLAAAERAGGPSVPLLTFDIRVAAAARSMGYTVVGG